MSEGKTIREHIEYYMQYAEEYYDKFMTYYNSKEACRRLLNEVWDDYVKHNKCLAKCSDDTKQVYRNMYSNIRLALIQSQRDKANDFYLNFVNDTRMKKLLDQYGSGVKGKAIKVTDTRKVAEAILALVIPELEKIMHLKGIKPVKSVSINAHSLIDFSEAEIIEE